LLGDALAVVELERCERARRPVLENLFQLYVHDFSEQWAGQPRGELQENGRFEDYPYFDSYWEDSERSGWLIRAGGKIAGFALISHSGLGCDHAMAEFFVVRKHRRSGVGREAALKLIGERAGLWELAISRANTGALVFWRGVARSLSDEVTELDLADERWNGAILRSRVP
jgi:predicted acetyltransferase